MFFQKSKKDAKKYDFSRLMNGGEMESIRQRRMPRRQKQIGESAQDQASM